LDLQDELAVTFRTIFSSTEWTNDTKGKTLEKYTIRQIEKTKHFNVKTKKITAPNTWLQNQQFTFHNLTVFHFEGNKKPPGSVDWSKSIIFVPDSCNYPDVDLLLWDPALANDFGFGAVQFFFFVNIWEFFLIFWKNPQNFVHSQFE